MQVSSLLREAGIPRGKALMTAYFALPSEPPPGDDAVAAATVNDSADTDSEAAFASETASASEFKSASKIRTSSVIDSASEAGATSDLELVSETDDGSATDEAHSSVESVSEAAEDPDPRLPDRSDSAENLDAAASATEGGPGAGGAAVADADLLPLGPGVRMPRSNAQASREMTELRIVLRKGAREAEATLAQVNLTSAFGHDYPVVFRGISRCAALCPV